MSRRRLHSLAASAAALGLILATTPAAARVASSTSGSGDFLVLGTMPGSFTYEAIVDDAGAAKGTFHYELIFQGQLADFDGEVTCVTFDAATNRAWIGGVVTANRSVHPSYTTPRTQVGEDIWFRVVDYGEGSSDPDDRTTFVGFAGDRDIPTSAAYCALQPWVDGDVSTWPVVEGNLQVRP
jgi:hypothetical protein